MEGGDTVAFDLATKDRYIETIKKQIENGDKTRVSDIVALA